MSLIRPAGQVITFYSYKGGTGRSMALANVACLLARQSGPGRRVLVIDWDLEAPGLHRFFQPYLKLFNQASPNDEALLDTYPGLLEIFEYLEQTTPRSASVEAFPEEALAAQIEVADFDQYLLEVEVPGAGQLSLLKAGRLDNDYARRVNAFKWEDLYHRLPGLFSGLVNYLTRRFDYVLIDSRTGLTDVSGICTMLMPERLVVVFTPNRQSLAGLADLVKRATDYRRQSDDLRPLQIFPLPSRIEFTEPDLHERWRFGDPAVGIPGYQTWFEELFRMVYGLPICNLGPYFDEVQIQHIPRYAYGETIAVLIEQTADRLSLARSYEGLSEALVSLAGPWEARPKKTVFRLRSVERAPHRSWAMAIQRTGKYEILEEIGRGGYATVYRAQHSTLKSEVALKVLDPARAADSAMRERFIREARTASKLEHPSIVEIFDLFEVPEGICISMEYFPGGDLQAWRGKRPALTVLEALQILKDVASALDYAHQQKAVHRDVKPSNILMDAKGRAHLSDFGLVFLPEAPHLTSSGSVVGTPIYYSPEQAAGNYPSLDARSDQYSLGVVAYELLVGRPPFQVDPSSGALALALKHIEEKPPSPHSLNADLPPELDEPMLKALAKKPEERFATCAEFMRQLEKALGDSRLRQYRELIQAAYKHIDLQNYELAQTALIQARYLLPTHPDWQAGQRKLEETRQGTETYELLVKEWEAALKDAQNALTLDPRLPDPNGVFIALGLHPRPPRPMIARVLETAQLGVGAVLGGAVIWLAWSLAHSWIVR
jgi:cellulose biosynthesis protein BcsQ/tRNA A-37 threonylcarbamoyl transferase component Bud32